MLSSFSLALSVLSVSIGVDGFDLRAAMKVVLISTYELGHQPFGLASPAAWLRREGHDVFCLDTSQQALRDHESTIAAAEAIAFYLPMHTATRIATHAIRRAKVLNPKVRLCAYGLYAPMNAELLHELGIEKIIGGEFEKELVQWVAPADSTSGVRTPHPHHPPPSFRRHNEDVSLEKLTFITPEREGLPPLRKYAKLCLPNGKERTAGYTEATRGCKHLCRHCPIVPVYHGTFRVVQRDVVLADIRQQVAAGAQHITFGDPDFFNGPTHSIGIVQSLHRQFPELTYDATIKVEHLLNHSGLLPILKETGCSFVVTAVESFDDQVLEKLQKGHTKNDFLRVLDLCREVGLNLAPTFLAFTPWTTLESYEEFLSTLAQFDLVPNLPSIQLAIRLLIPSGSYMLELPEVQQLVQPFDRERLCYPWSNPDRRVDQLQSELESLVQSAAKAGVSRASTFAEVRRRTAQKLNRSALPEIPLIPDRATIPYLTEPWYC
jgi:radical SAM superfamily enzyme YgiQ (UPF0313 family)